MWMKMWVGVTCAWQLAMFAVVATDHAVKWPPPDFLSAVIDAAVFVVPPLILLGIGQWLERLRGLGRTIRA